MSKKYKTKKNSKLETVETKPKRDTSPKVYQNEKIDYHLDIRERDDLTDKQKQLIELIEDRNTKAVFIQGPAGTSKTFVALLAGLRLLNNHSVSDIVYVRSIIESASKSLGSLPGEANDKMAPFLMPLRDKLDELLPKAQVNKLIADEKVTGIPVNYLRGASINAKVVVADESQNYSWAELVTILTRLGKFSKFLILGDPVQSDIGKNSGFMKMFNLFNDQSSRDQGIHCFSFTKDDIVRSGVLKYIIERIEGDKQIQTAPQPMFINEVKK